MAFPTIQTSNTSSQGTNTTSHTVNLPSGITKGDLILVFAAIDGLSVPTFPDGWGVNVSTAGVNVTLAIAYRRADGSEGGTVVFTTAGSEQSSHYSIRLSDAGLPVFSASAATGNNTTPDPPAITVPATLDYLFACACASDGGILATAGPTEYTDGFDVGPDTGTNGADIAIALLFMTDKTDNPTTFTLASADDWACRTLVVGPPNMPIFGQQLRQFQRRF